ncbi:MAG: alpha-N-arabinofuranosidase [Candidatus Pelagisphaera sp.]
MFCLLICSVKADTTVSIDPEKEEHAISKMALGTGLIYSWNADEIYQSEEMPHIIKDIGFGALRWPGGTLVTFYNWNDLTGQGWQDHWNPNYDRAAQDKPPSTYMDLDEYLALIDETGAEIMLGVNMSSGKEWDREAEGIEEARQLMITCKAKGYDVKYIYFDNENFQEGNNYNRDDNDDGKAWDPTSYAHSFNLYAAAVKETYPDAKLIANAHNDVTGPNFRNHMLEMLPIAGNNIDLVDVHYYWQWATATWDIWKSQKPMKRKGNETYEISVEEGNKFLVDEGYPHVRLAIMEWNIAPGPWETDTAHNKFRTALMQSEMQMQFIQGGLDIGMLWALDVPSVDSTNDKHVIHNGEANGAALWMWLYSKAGGKTLVEASSDKEGVFVAALKGPSGDMAIYLLNKNDADENVSLNLDGYDLTDVSEAWRFHDGGKGLGALERIGLWVAESNLQTTLKANSLNMIGLAYPPAPEPAAPELHAKSVHSVPEGILAAWDRSAGAPDRFQAGIDAFLGGRFYGVDTTAGSTDGDFSGGIGETDTAPSSFTVRMDSDKNALNLEIVNRSGAPLMLDAVHFDYAPWWIASPKNVSLVYAEGDLSEVARGATLQSVEGLANLGMKSGDYYDFEWSLSGLADRVIDHDERVVLKLVASNANPGGEWANGAFDNIAITGSSLPGRKEGMLFSWLAETGREYKLEKSSTLQSTDWQPASETVVGEPGEMSLPVEMGTDPAFYRLGVQP